MSNQPKRPTGRAGLRRLAAPLVAVLLLPACASSGKPGVYHDANMDFSQIQRLAVLPFANFTPTTTASDRVRDVFMTTLQAGGSLYVLPPGETQRAIARVRLSNPTQPTGEEAIAIGKEAKVEAIITGAVREYGEVRSGNTSSNVVSISVQLMETQSGKVVWTASSTKGGVSTRERLFGSKGEPMNVVTEKAARELIDKLFK